ncbi:MAG: prephenate dehydratase [Lewinellaceae bacterium]|nr:prephenate dehydratase [Saprospiraceae bacterium]MCB9341427.1 prephenate dehydratase [Lewinellaceae bacterium]
MEISSTLEQTKTAQAVPQKNSRIVIQGVRGAFHEIAARKFFGENIKIVPALSFAELFEKMEAGGTADAAIMAIENSIAGSILRNYHLLQHSDLTITGEVYLRIEQHLMALPGVDISQLKEVQSHPMALAQCALFFKKHPHIKLTESADTAESAARIQQENLWDVGAVGSELAAGAYGLDIIVRCIETNHRNFTRFLALEPKDSAVANPLANKASVSFSTSHEPGSLSRILSMLASQGVNLTKIQSVPILGKPWQYLFFVDFIAENKNALQSTLECLKEMALQTTVLGTYKSDNWTTNNE